MLSFGNIPLEFVVGILTRLMFWSDTFFPDAAMRHGIRKGQRKVEAHLPSLVYLQQSVRINKSVTLESGVRNKCAKIQLGKLCQLSGQFQVLGQTIPLRLRPHSAKGLQ